MKVVKILIAASIVGVATTSMIGGTAFAWHPKGVIVKYVQNQTTGGDPSDANDPATAVSVKPGDVLKYTIEIRNDGAAHENDWNDMHFTKLVDTLPVGVELVGDSSRREIVEDIGRLKAGEKVVKEYTVKVTSTQNDSLIENEACFTGDSEKKDAPQEGCDSAAIKVTALAVLPQDEQPPKEEPKEESPATVGTSTALPQTGASSLFVPALAISSGTAAYAGRLATLKRRGQQ